MWDRTGGREGSTYPISTTLQKAFAIIEHIAGHQPVAATTLGAELHLSKGNTYHLLASLEHLGYIRKSRDGYELTFRMYAIGSTLPITQHVVNIARPLMRQIAQDEGIHVYLTVESNLEMVNLEREQPRSDIQVANDYAVTYELHCTASGKLWLSFLQPSRRREIYREMSFAKKTGHTITDPDTLEREVSQIARQGYAVELTEHSPYINGVAAPIVGRDEEFVASLSVVGPTPILTKAAIERLTPRLVESAATVSRSL